MKKNKYLSLLLLPLIFLLLIDQSFAYDFTLSLGNLCEYIGKIQTDDQGKTNICSLNPLLSTSYDYAYNEQWTLSPEFGFTLPKSGRDENIKKASFFILANTKYNISEYHLLSGLGIFFTKISGDGGSEELNNGNSSVSFTLPDSTIYTRNLILNLGAGRDFNKKWSADIHTFIFNLLKSEDRSYSIAVNGTYHFGEF